jgi:hypothetical protein
MTPTPYAAWVLARLIADLPVTAAELAVMPNPWRVLAEKLAAAMIPADRLAILEGFRLAQPDPDAIVKAIADQKATDPAPPIDPPRRFATCADIARVQAGTAGAWQGWLPSSRIVGVAAGEGVGKTRFALDLDKRVWHGEPWPDGQAMTLPPKSPTIWVAADGQHDELAATLSDLGMPPEAIVFPTYEDDPYGGTSLDEDDTWKSLDEACRVIKPWAIMVDSLTYATRWDIGEQRTIARLKAPLVRLAQTHQVLIMILLHLSKEGVALGRRIRGITRTLMHLEAPDPTRPERLRLWVEKSYAAKPTPLGVTIGSAGNTYDFTPPAPSDSSKGGRPPAEREKAAIFIRDSLSKLNDQKLAAVLAEWTKSGGSEGTFWNARDAMVSAGELTCEGKPKIIRLISAQQTPAP